MLPFDDECPGSRVTVLGTSNVSRSAGGSTDPSWQCLVDNVSITSKAPAYTLENNWFFCDSNTVSDGRHTITLRATVRNPATVFWFDQIQYLPSASALLDSSFILVQANDSAVQYGPGWQDMRGIGKMTLLQGAKVTFDFNGVYFILM